jgi:hypothetical protein
MISKTRKQTPIVLALVAAAVAALSIVVGLNLNSAQLSSLETGRQIMPDSSISSGQQKYAHNWDDNPVAYLPEATMILSASRYAHNWDDNPVAYIPETEVNLSPGRYMHNWDKNPVAYIPEATLIGVPRK